MYPGHLSTSHQFLEKRCVKVLRTLTFNFSVYLYVGPYHARAVCTRYPRNCFAGKEDDVEEKGVSTEVFDPRMASVVG